MFIVALLLIEGRKKLVFINEQISKMWYMYTMDYHSAFRKESLT